MNQPELSKSKSGEEELKNIYHSDHVANLEKLKDFCPDYMKIIQEFGLGTIWQRPGLPAREKELIVLSSLITMGGAEPEIRQHVHTAFKRGVALGDILECIILLTVYIGIPRTLNALEIIRDEMEKHR